MAISVNQPLNSWEWCIFGKATLIPDVMADIYSMDGRWKSEVQWAYWDPINLWGKLLE